MTEVEMVADEMAEGLYLAKEGLKGARGLSGLLAAAPAIAEWVEVEAKKRNWKGVKKMELAIAIALRLVPLPIWIPRPVAEMVLRFAFEAAVAGFNKKALPRLQAAWKAALGWLGLGG